MKRLVLFVVCLLVGIFVAAAPRIYRGGHHTDATYLVVASDAPGNFRRGGPCIWLCDGTADDVEIQAAQDALQNISNAWDWTTEAGSPISELGYFGCVIKIGATYYQFYGKSNDIYYATSSDGTTFTEQGTALTQGAGGNWDDEDVQNTFVTYNGTHYLLLYRGYDGSIYGVGAAYATAANVAKGSWTKIDDGGSDTDEGRLINNNLVTDNLATDSCALINDGGSIYLWTNSGNTVRRDGIVLWKATETDLTAWEQAEDAEASEMFTEQQPSPLFTGNRYCPTVWEVDATNYYMLVCKHRSPSSHGLVELWHSSDPRFLPAHRRFLGVVLYSSVKSLDTPYVVTTDWDRDSVVENRCYFAIIGGPELYLTTSIDVTDYVTPRAGKVVLSPGTFSMAAPDASYYRLYIDYGMMLEGYGARIKLPDSHATNSAPGLVYVTDDAVIRGMAFDGNRTTATGTQHGVDVSGGKAEDVTVEEWTGYGFIDCRYGTLRRCLSRRNGADGYAIQSGARLFHCDGTGNGADGLTVTAGDSVQVIGGLFADNVAMGIDAESSGASVFSGVEVCYNGSVGAAFTKSNIDVHAHHNTTCGVRAYTNCIGKIRAHDEEDGVNVMGAATACDLTVHAEDCTDYGVIDASTSYGNVIRGTYDNCTREAIYLLGDDNVVSGASFFECGTTPGCAITDNAGIRNKYLGCYFDQGTLTIGYGMALRGSVAAVVEGCYADVNVRMIWADGSSAGATLRDNPGTNPGGYDTAWYPDVTEGASPYTWTNAEAATGANYACADAMVVVTGGTVTQVEVSLDGTNYYVTGRTVGEFFVPVGGKIKVTYDVVPVMTVHIL